ncbi:energy transducer TonB [Porphyromonas macacae]|uniref:TonB family C-terminal domain n=1 Tax=Porphyromonas macacae TaxID=28115 RepID=A0A379DHQ6_9PORP|nr:energy transducer TonB [Porphyromonas macacae]SUB77682.1 TonB family C-terminal domain [Porphyromonas macacae]
MEIKKSPKANLEKQKGLSLLMGLVVALAIVYVSLEYRSLTKHDDNIIAKIDIADVDEQLLIEDQKQPEPEPEPEVAKIEVQLPEEFEVVSNEKEVAKVTLISGEEDKKLPPPTVIVPQVSAADEEAEKIFTVVEKNPEFPGGINEMYKYLRENINYPQIAADNGVQGKVHLGFVVERDGSITQIQVIRGVDPELDKEAIRVVKSMPKWKPGQQQGRPVRCRFTLPVTFQLM